MPLELAGLSFHRFCHTPGTSTMTLLPTTHPGLDQLGLHRSRDPWPVLVSTSRLHRARGLLSYVLCKIDKTLVSKPPAEVFLGCLQSLPHEEQGPQAAAIQSHAIDVVRTMQTRQPLLMAVNLQQLVVFKD